MDIVTPIIHLNGDRKETLVDNLKHAYVALRAAHTALQACAPNGRNYYPEDGRLLRAQKQHWQRIAHIKDVMESLSAEVEEIEDEYPTRKAP